MRRHQITFLLAGLVAGLLSVALGKATAAVLTVGVGLFLFAAIVSAIAITSAWRHLRRGVWRYLAAAILSTIAYILALLTFNTVAGYAPEWFGVRKSSDIVEFRLDVWLGLVAAAVVVSAGIVSLAAIFAGKWCNALFVRLVTAGVVTEVVTYVGNLPFHHYWSFMGVLLPVGNALLCWLVGAQI
jgi:hypothetical protein